MQQKKQNIEESILRIAEEEFYLNGYEGASLRRIIKQSGTSIGNFYNYFTNKESLFESLIKDEYEQFIKFITDHNHEEESFSISELNLKEQRELFSSMIGMVLPDFSKRFVILIEGSKGTKFENAKSVLAGVISEHLESHQSENHNVKPDKTIVELLSTQFIEGVISIVKVHNSDKVAQNKLITDYIIFYFMGVIGLIEDINLIK